MLYSKYQFIAVNFSRSFHRYWKSTWLLHILFQYFLHRKCIMHYSYLVVLLPESTMYFSWNWLSPTRQFYNQCLQCSNVMVSQFYCCIISRVVATVGGAGRPHIALDIPSQHSRQTHSEEENGNLSGANNVKQYVLLQGKGLDVTSPDNTVIFQRRALSDKRKTGIFSLLHSPYLSPTETIVSNKRDHNQVAETLEETCSLLDGLKIRNSSEEPHKNNFVICRRFMSVYFRKLSKFKCRDNSTAETRL